MTARKLKSHRSSVSTKGPYRKITSINGTHPFQEAAPGSYVSYPTRKRKRGKVCYFNFDLAKEMGVIPKNHSSGLNEELSEALLETFGLIIINEYDYINGKKFQEDDIKENFYMATRYLQMQHKSRIGLTSGDGRGIWNGVVESKDKTWDVTSNGTGATCLSPAAANNNKFYESGDPSISYGCGYAELQDAIGNSVFSEILHKNGVPTERTLCIIEYPNNFCVAVRSGQNLLRPSHFFNHLKQGHYQRLKSTFDFFINRQIANQVFKPRSKSRREKYDAALEYLSMTYAKVCARFEREYIFCWLDWDGDNMLADGGIIDYGSIRQLGMCHHQYRFDDDERWSTNLLEQRQKGRYIIQTFCQLIDFLKTGRKKSREKFKNHKALRKFDDTFAYWKQRFLLEKIGFEDKAIDFLTSKHHKTVDRFTDEFEFFERLCSKKGEVQVADGVSKHAIFNMRDLLRDLPEHFIENSELLDGKKFQNLMSSGFSSKKDLHLSESRLKRVEKFQKLYLKLIDLYARQSKGESVNVLKSIHERSSRINRYDRVTGDGMYYVGEHLHKIRKKLSSDEWSQLIKDFVNSQVLDPKHGYVDALEVLDTAKSSPKHLRVLIDIIRAYREGL